MFIFLKGFLIDESVFVVWFGTGVIGWRLVVMRSIWMTGALPPPSPAQLWSIPLPPPYQLTNLNPPRY